MVLLIFSYGATPLLAQADEGRGYLPLVDAENHPLGLVEECINVITGTYCDSQTDITVPGPEPLTFKRFYSSANSGGGSLSSNWFSNHALKASLAASEATYKFTVSEATGGALNYYGGSANKSVPKYCMEAYQRTNEDRGLTNTKSGELAGRTNRKNQTASYDSNNTTLHVKLCDGNLRTLVPDTSWTEQQALPVHFVVKSEGLRSGNQLIYNYKERPAYHFQKQIRRHTEHVAMTDATGEITFSLLRVDYQGCENAGDTHIMKLCANDGREVFYTFRYHPWLHGRDSGDKWHLVEVLPANSPKIAYQYVSHPGWQTALVNRKLVAGRVVQELDYYRIGDNQIGDTNIRITSSDTRIGRVSSLKTPVGLDSLPVLTHRFFYTDQQTDVRDALNRRTVYHYNTDERLGGIDHYVGQSNYSLYCADRFYWGERPNNQTCDLRCKALLYSDGSYHHCCVMDYDDKHNVIAEHLIGNLSGTCKHLPRREGEGIPQPHGCECYTVKRTYTTDGTNRLTSETLPNGLVTQLRYKPGTHLVTAKISRDDSQILEREFHDYNAHGCLVKTVVDNGKGELLDDLTGVSVRKITYITPRESTPCYGLPEVVEERYLDLALGAELLLHRTVNSYTVQGWLTCQEHYDANDELRYVIHREYDDLGNIILDQDALGRTTVRRFDELGNKIYEQGPDTSHHFEYTYDAANRLVSERQVCVEGGCFTQTYRYDFFGNKVSSTDIYGHETSYQYDDLNRLIKTTLPACMSKFGAPIVTSSLEYDIAGNVTSLTDFNGGITRKTYTIRGEPSLIVHPDGSSEHLVYNLDGTLAAHTLVDGTTRRFTYDALGNRIREEFFSASGARLALSLATYNGKVLSSETDANGNTTRYAYDGAGRLVAVHKPYTTIRYAYDALGRKSSTSQSISGDSDLRISKYVHDLLDRIVEERTEDSSGTLLTQFFYGYDRAGRPSVVTGFDENGACTTRSFYDARGQTERTVDAEGNETIIQHNYSHMNTYGQRVLQVTQIDPLGGQTITTHDVLGRIESIVQLDSYKNEIARTGLVYDSQGNLIKRVESVKAEGAEDRKVTTRWNYDALNRVVVLTEASGTSQQRQTYYAYNLHGQKTSEIFPDNTTLKYMYDVSGRLKSCVSTDGTLAYLYEYDSKGNVLRVDDQINGIATRRVYDRADRVTREEFANGLTVRYQYDGLDRLTRLDLHDGSAVSWTYDAAFMRAVNRIGTNGNISLTHRYLAYDLGGHLLSAKMIGYAGDQSYRWDRLGHVRSIESAVFQQVIPQDGYDATGNLREEVLHDLLGELACSYTYDARNQIATETGISPHAYLYDSLGNRLMRDSDACDFDGLNQILRQGEVIYTYDGRGNRTSRTNGEEVTQYAYDALNRLIEVVSGSERYVYAYDFFNRRLNKRTYAQDGIKQWKQTKLERYLYQGQTEIGAVDSKGHLIQYRALGKDNESVWMEIDGKNLATLLDRSGHVRALVNASSGGVAEFYCYGLFGDEECYAPSYFWGWHVNPDPINPWRFSSGRYDPETKFFYGTHSYYDPETGCFLGK